MWTEQIPTLVGWYWWRQDISSVAIILRVDGNHTYGCHSPSHMVAAYHELMDMGGEWYGPLEVPLGDIVEDNEGKEEMYIPEGYYFKDDLDGGRLVKKPHNEEQS